MNDIFLGRSPSESPEPPYAAASATIQRPSRMWMRIHKFLFLPRILEPEDRKRLYVLTVLFLAFGGLFFTRMYIRATVSVPAIGGTYREGLLKTPRSINPIYATSNDTDRDLVKLIFSRLITYDGEGKPILDLAENYEISDDGKTYTVPMKKNAYWHDGQKVTAEDVLFTVKTIQNPAYKSPLAANWQGVQIEKVDEYTVRFTLRAPYAPFLENLTVGIIPRHLWEDIPPDQVLLHQLNLKPVGSGPYQFDRFIQDKNGVITEYQLTRNPEYYSSGPYIRQIIFVFYDSFDVLLGDWRRGLINGFTPITKAIETELSDTRNMLFAIRTPRVFSLFFNPQKSDILGEKKIREAIGIGISRSAVADYLLGKATTLESPLPTFLIGTEKENTPEAYDPEAARKIIVSLGYADIDNDGIFEKTVRKTENKKTTTATSTLSFTITTSDWPDLLRAAEIIQNNLGAIGIDATINARSVSALDAEVLRPRNFEILLFGQAYGYEPDPFIFWHSSQGKDPGLNIVRFSDATSDKLLEEIRSESNRDEREKHIQELSSRIQESALITPLYEEEYLYVLPKGVHGVNLKFISLPSDRFNEITKWYMNTDRVFK